MPWAPPIYIDNHKTYHADTCIPLKKAAEKGSITFYGVKRGNYPGIELPNNALPGINNIGYWDITSQQDWGLTWHRNEGIEFTFLENGTLHFDISGKEASTLRANDLTITRPWQPHRLGDPSVSASRLYWVILDVGVRRPHQEWKWPSWIILDEEDLQELTYMLRKNEEPVWHANSEFSDCFRNIKDSLIQVIEGGSISKLAIQINELLILIHEMFGYRKIPLNHNLMSANRNVELFLKEIKHNLSEPWTLETMAASCGMGITRFTHYCVKIENMTPIQYLNNLRLEKAAGLLTETNRKIIDIAFDCGFNSSQYFSNVFKQHYNASPALYRKNKKSSFEKYAV